MINKKDFQTIFIILYLIIQGLVFYTAWIVLVENLLSFPFYEKGNYIVVLTYLIVNYLFSRIYGSFNVQEYRIIELFYASSLSSVFSLLIMYFIVSLVNRSLLSIKPYFIILFFIMMISFITIFIANRIFVSNFKNNKTLVLSALEKQNYLFQKFRTRPHFINLIQDSDFFDINSKDKELFEKIAKYNNVLIDTDNLEQKQKVIIFCQSKGLNIFIIPNIQDTIIKNSEFTHLYDIPLLKVDNNFNISFLTVFIKRLVDVSVSIIILFLSSPILLLIYIFIKREDNGPFLYIQKRLTKDEKEFNLYKVRSMKINAEVNGIALMAKENDNRITKIGSVIRKYRIDEIPQLVNVIKGEMSLVGPRPERPEMYKVIEEDIPDFKLRLKVKAGLTGYAQVYGKYNTPLNDKLIMDLEYIESFSTILDFKILLMTVKIIFMKESTEGYK